jgi:S1-C subfamily serine protease
MEGEDYPTLPIASAGDMAGLRPGSDLFILGYPGALALDDKFSERSRLEPSLTAGHVSAIKDTSEGWKAIQTDAAISPGNSGGPALNDEGMVVGLATFTVNGERTQNLNFAISAEVVQEFLNELHITLTESAYTGSFLKALEAYENNNRQLALTLFSRLNAAHPESSPIRDFVRRLDGKPVASATALDQPEPVKSPAVVERPDSRGTSPQPPSQHAGPRIFLVIVSIVLIVGAGFVLLIIRKP